MAVPGHAHGRTNAVDSARPVPTPETGGHRVHARVLADALNLPPTRSRTDPLRPNQLDPHSRRLPPRAECSPRKARPQPEPAPSLTDTLHLTCLLTLRSTTAPASPTPRSTTTKPRSPPPRCSSGPSSGSTPAVSPSLQALMVILGHSSAEMSLRYGRLFDSTVRDEYERALDLAKQRIGAMPPTTGEDLDDGVDWRTTPTIKTALAGGYCLPACPRSLQLRQHLRELHQLPHHSHSSARPPSPT